MTEAPFNQNPHRPADSTGQEGRMRIPRAIQEIIQDRLADERMVGEGAPDHLQSPMFRYPVRIRK